MKWKLDFQFERLRQLAEYTDKILIAGSCFAENIGNFLVKHKFDALINPHGILYNPESIVRSLDVCLTNYSYKEEDLFFDHGLWHSWNHHESFSDPDKTVCLHNINNHVHKAHEQLLRARWLILTLGSAGVYRLKKDNTVVGNCHKQPAAVFDFDMITPERAIIVLEEFVRRLFLYNKEIRIIFTVSPVRYIRYGLIESNLGKSVLLYAVHHLVKKFERLHYFPSYEIVVDELRDYRFYSEDLVHPNSVATKYVWEKFTDYFLSENANEILQEIVPLLHAAEHRPLHRESEEYKQFASAQIKKIGYLKDKYPFLDFTPELNRFLKINN